VKEFVFAGLLISPFVKYALIAALIFIPIRFVLVVSRLQKWFWHPLLAEAGIYICVVAAMNILL
jgi:predicted DNA repair protein MutK